MLSIAAAVLSTLVGVQGDGIRLEYDAQMRSRVVSTIDGAMPLGEFQAAEALFTAVDSPAFHLDAYHAQAVDDALGAGTRTVIDAHAPGIAQQIQVTAYASRPHFLFVQVRYTNTGAAPLRVAGYAITRYALAAPPGAKEPAFWSYQSASFEKRPDWILPVAAGFKRRNFLGMNDSDYGGGTPVLDVWRADAGLAIGSMEMVPKQISLPLERGADGPARIALRNDEPQVLAPGASLSTVLGFVAVHRGDYFSTLRAYSQAMQARGLKFAQAPKTAFEPLWCAWGYGRKFTPDQVFETLPVAKRLGFKWAVLDDGWQAAIGDWTPVKSKFPRGDADMKALVDRIHAAGMKAQLWWSPLAASPQSELHRAHPDWLLRNKDRSTRNVSWWDSDYLCPAYGPVRADAASFVRKALLEWGFDGLKIDGQHLNAAPPCFNPAHHHAHPDDAPEGVPGFFKGIWDAAQSAKPGALVEICPCGTGYSIYTLPYLNMMVAADPESSWQVRTKGKTLKAIAGDGIAYFGDHVEMSRDGEDFASTVGVGGVIGSNFAWRNAPGEKDPKLLLTPHREKLWAEWTRIYQRTRLSEGEYLGGLYDIGFDRPEGHVVRKGAKLYYAFFADAFDGEIELRGLQAQGYRLRDYVSGNALGEVRGPSARVPARFRHSLLIEAAPIGVAATTSSGSSTPGRAIASTRTAPPARP